MDKISSLKKEIIDTLDFNKATDIVSIDLEGKSSMAIDDLPSRSIETISVALLKSSVSIISFFKLEILSIN